MTNQLPYRSTIKSKSLFYNETYKLAELHVQGCSESDIKDQIINKNLLQVQTLTRKKEITTTVLKRLKLLDDYLIQQITEADISTSKIIVLYAVLQTDRLFYEFMDEVFKEKRLIQDSTLSDRDFNVFFEAKRHQSETVAKWKDYTFYKLQQVYMRMLTESGLVRGRGDREIQLPMVNLDILDYIRTSGEPRFINVIV